MLGNVQTWFKFLSWSILVTLLLYYVLLHNNISLYKYPNSPFGFSKTNTQKVELITLNCEILPQTEREKEMEIWVLPVATLALILLLKLMFCWWISPIQTHHKLKRCGFGGPPPSFPLGNIQEMKNKNSFKSSVLGSSKLTHDIHSIAFPYFSRWQNSHGQLSKTTTLIGRKRFWCIHPTPTNHHKLLSSLQFVVVYQCQVSARKLNIVVY